MSDNNTGDEVSGVYRAERVSGTVQCNHCEYWGLMDGYIDVSDNKYIQFLCPECESIEKVVNFGVV